MLLLLLSTDMFLSLVTGSLGGGTCAMKGSLLHIFTFMIFPLSLFHKSVWSSTRRRMWSLDVAKNPRDIHQRNGMTWSIDIFCQYWKKQRVNTQINDLEIYLHAELNKNIHTTTGGLVSLDSSYELRWLMYLSFSVSRVQRWQDGARW